MIFTIEKFKGVHSATIEVDKIALIFGPNGAGKSSTGDAIKSIAIGSPYCGQGVKTKTKFVNKTASSGQVLMEIDDSVRKIEWPSKQVTTAGAPPTSSEVGIGLARVLDFKKDDKANFFIDLLKAKPKKEDLANELKSLSESEIDDLWKEISENSWDALSKHYKELGTRQKGAWSEVTGKRWGSSVASNFIPEHWSPMLDKASKSDLESKIVAARENVEGIVAAIAIDDSEIDRLTIESQKIPFIRENIETIETNLERLDVQLLDIKAHIKTSSFQMCQDLFKKHSETNIDQLEKTRADLSAKTNTGRAKLGEIEEKLRNINHLLLQYTGNTSPLLCPHCNGEVIYRDGALKKKFDIPTEEHDSLMDSKTDLEKRADKAHKWISDRKEECRILGEQIGWAKKAREIDFDKEMDLYLRIGNTEKDIESEKNTLEVEKHKLKNAIADSKTLDEILSQSQGVSDSKMNEIREELRICELNLQAWIQKDKADQIAKTIAHYISLSKTLGVDGLRKKILSSKLDKANKSLAQWCPWPLTIKGDLSFELFNWPAEWSSQSEKWRVNTSIQILTALIKKDPLIVIDEADILDSDGKKKLIGTISKMPFKSVLISKSNTPNDVIPSSANVNSYWVSNGEAAPI